MNNNLHIYEAGCLTYLYDNNLFDLAIEWRNKLDKFAIDNNIKTFNPANTFLNERNHTYSGNMAVKQNDFYLMQTNLMVVQLDYIGFSSGTLYELPTYKWMHKPVIGFGRPSKSPHINSCISEYCNNIDEVIELLCNMFNQSFK